MLKEKIERLELGGKRIQFSGILGHCGIEVNERAHSAAKQSIRECRERQLLLSVANLKV
jgi:hypothetical protein